MENLTNESVEVVETVVEESVSNGNLGKGMLIGSLVVGAVALGAGAIKKYMSNRNKPAEIELIEVSEDEAEEVEQTEDK